MVLLSVIGGIFVVSILFWEEAFNLQCCVLAYHGNSYFVCKTYVMLKDNIQMTLVNQFTLLIRSGINRRFLLNLTVHVEKMRITGFPLVFAFRFLAV
jgi:hypothetical protein